MLHGTYAGIVEANNDSEKLGRLKVRVPHVYGAAGGSAGYIGTNDIPWALPAGMPAGGSGASGGFSHIPEIGDKVWVRFLDGEPEKPIWEWGMQSRRDRDAMPLHSYDDDQGKVGKPNRTFWTKYGHGIEMNLGSMISTTSAGYRVVLTDSSQPGANDGNVNVSTPAGNFLEFDDSGDSLTLNVNEDGHFNFGSSFGGRSDSYSWQTMSLGMEFKSGNTYKVTASGAISFGAAKTFSADAIGDMNLSSDADINVNGQNVSVLFNQLQLGDAAVEPYVLGNQIVLLLNSLLTYLATHTHSNGNEGSPTGPPIVPPLGVVQPMPENVISSSIFGM